MEQAALTLEQKRFRFDAFTAHCAKAVQCELQRRNISARNLKKLDVIKTRDSFTDRLTQGRLSYDELQRLIQYLEIDMVRVTISFLSDNPSGAYENSVFDNFSGIVSALVSEYDRSGHTRLPTMEPMRATVMDTLAKRVFEQVCTHNNLVNRARNTLSQNELAAG